MTGSLDFKLHFWRGIGPDREPDLFVARYRLGFATVAIERADLLATVRKLRAAIAEALQTSGGMK